MRCSAKAKSTGVQCGGQAITGCNVCRLHGGSAKQVREKARLRVMEMVDPALAALYSLVQNKKQPGVRLAAAKDILDRAAIGEPPATQVASGTTIQVVVLSAGADSVGPSLDITAMVQED